MVENGVSREAERVALLTSARMWRKHVDPRFRVFLESVVDYLEAGGGTDVEVERRVEVFPRGDAAVSWIEVELGVKLVPWQRTRVLETGEGA